MAGAGSTTVYGTVMGTRLEGRDTVHRIEATGPGGARIDFEVVARKRHTGAVKVAWDPDGHIEPRFRFEMPWAPLGLIIGIATVIVFGGWLLFG